MNTTISATNARAKLYDLLEDVDTLGKRIAITKQGKTKAILINPEELASWEETLEVMSDNKLMRDIKRGLDDIKAGRVIAWSQIKKTKI
ncbi:MAG: type II toxin-antitoxin system Phd/YefM family antitoxin [Candidatus Curtissbacteria bacterium]